MAKSTLHGLGERAVFLKKNWQIAYAAVLIVLIPVTVAANTMFVVNRFRKTVDVEMQRTALMVGRAFTATSADLLGDEAKLQERVSALGAAIPEVKTLDLLARDGEDFRVVASLDPAAVGETARSRQNILAWYDDQAIAALTRSGRAAAFDQKVTPDELRSGRRYWSVVMPVAGPDEKPAYLLSTKLSLDVIDVLVASNLFWSYLWLVVTVLIVILVLISNTRLFQYAALYRKLQEVDAMKDDFISMASHELRAPITAVRGYLSLFLENAFMAVEGKAREAMQVTFHLATHLGTLVDDLLDVSRIEQGRMKLDIGSVAVEPLIGEIIDAMKFEAKKKGLTLEYRRPAFAEAAADAPLPPVLADRDRLKQVLINLVSNAVKYTPAGSVTVTSEVKEANRVEIRVIDTGLGMSAEQRERLFTKFYRVKTDDTRDIPGTGLGLWITKQIVENMKGRIFCDSIEKVGTQMSVVLPASVKSFPSAKAAEDRSAGKTSASATAPAAKGGTAAKSANDAPC
jgi:signal transduction histidine kinase